MAEKPKSGTVGEAVTVWNLSDRPLALPDGTLLPVADIDEEDDKGTVVQDWGRFDENGTVQKWVDDGLIEIGEAPPEEEPLEEEANLTAGPRLQEKGTEKEARKAKAQDKAATQPGVAPPPPPAKPKL